MQCFIIDTLLINLHHKVTHIIYQNAIVLNYHLEMVKPH